MRTGRRAKEQKQRKKRKKPFLGKPPRILYAKQVLIKRIDPTIPLPGPSRVCQVGYRVELIRCRIGCEWCRWYGPERSRADASSPRKDCLARSVSPSPSSRPHPVDAPEATRVPANAQTLRRRPSKGCSSDSSPRPT